MKTIIINNKRKIPLRVAPRLKGVVKNVGIKPLKKDKKSIK